MSQIAQSGAGADTATVSSSSVSTQLYGTFGSASLLAVSTGYTGSAGNFIMHMRGASTLQAMNVNVGANSRSTTTTVKTAGSGGANLNQAIAITAGATGVFTDATHTDSLADGANYGYSITFGSGATAINISGIGIQIVAAAQCYCQLGSMGSGAGPGTGTTTYYALGGHVALNTTESLVQTPMLESATLSNLQMREGDGDPNGTLRSRIGGSNGNQVLTTGAAFQEDTTHTDAVVAGNLVDMSFVTTTGGPWQVQLVSMKYLGSTTNQTPIYTAGAAVAGVGALRYWPLGGHTSQTATESDTQYPLASAGTLNNLAVRVTVNSIGSSVNWQLRIAAANANQVAAITASTTGVFTDATHTDAVVAGALIDCSSPTGFTSSATVAAFGVLFATAPPTTTITVDSSVRAEFGQGLFGDGVGRPEWRVGLFADAAAPAAWGAGLALDSGARLEVGGGQKGGGATPTESRGGLFADLPAPAEALAAIESDGSVPAESLGPASTAIFSDGVARVEWRMGVAGDAGARADWLAGLLRDSGAAAEWGWGLFADSLSRVEFGASVFIDGMSKAEALAALTAHAGAPTDWLGHLIADSGAAVDSLRSLNADGGAAIEALHGLFADIPAPTEWLAHTIVTSDAGTRVDWVQGVIADAASRVEFGAHIESDSVSAVETGTGVFADAAALVQWLSGIRIRRIVSFVRGRIGR